MELSDSAIKAFLRQFERNNNAGELEALVAQFTEVFLVAGNQEVKAVPAKAFALALPKRKQLFAELGCRSSKLISIAKTPLDSHHALVQTQWQMNFINPENRPEEVVVASKFVLTSTPDGIKILCYSPDQDIMAVLKDRGILPPT